MGTEVYGVSKRIPQLCPPFPRWMALTGPVSALLAALFPLGRVKRTVHTVLGSLRGKSRRRRGLSARATQAVVGVGCPD